MLSDATVRVTGSRPTSIESYCYYVVALRKILATFLGVGWPYADLHDTLRWEADEDADNIRPIYVLSDNNKASSLQPDDLEASVQKESANNFYSNQMPHTASVPFGVVPMHLALSQVANVARSRTIHAPKTGLCIRP